ncbi:urease accessory protein UreD [Acetobacter oryzifermentans]|uniref:Urease accessory protein UreD n=1 Tax=Acetobacter oryzifermentans TaxID=1633874 RepID=A0ABM6ALJ0_9PROT|nr:urease accessory protein UreD [Acetobacter oryzifermentans]
MPLLQRAYGRFGLEVRNGRSQTQCYGLEQEGCCRLLFPRVAGQQMEVVTVNISGGIAAGDRIEGDLRCNPHTNLLVTSQAAERIYRARSNDPSARINVSCHIAEDACLEWLPHGTIFFDGSRLQRKMTVEMADNARFLFLESRFFGRVASGECVEQLHVRDGLSVRRDGRRILEDTLKLESDSVNVLLKDPAVAAGYRAVTTLVLVASDVSSRLEPLRNVLAAEECKGFAASAWNGMLIVRGIAQDNWQLEVILQRILPILRNGQSMPTTWRS